MVKTTKSPPTSNTSVNQHIVDHLTHHAQQLRSRGDINKIPSFNRAIASLTAYPLPIFSANECNILRGVGPAISKMIEKFLQTHNHPLYPNGPNTPLRKILKIDQSSSSSTTTSTINEDYDDDNDSGDGEDDDDDKENIINQHTINTPPPPSNNNKRKESPLDTPNNNTNKQSTPVSKRKKSKMNEIPILSQSPIITPIKSTQKYLQQQQYQSPLTTQPSTSNDSFSFDFGDNDRDHNCENNTNYNNDNNNGTKSSDIDLNEISFSFNFDYPLRIPVPETPFPYNNKFINNNNNNNNQSNHSLSFTSSPTPLKSKKSITTPIKNNTSVIDLTSPTPLKHSNVTLSSTPLKQQSNMNILGSITKNKSNRKSKLKTSNSALKSLKSPLFVRYHSPMGATATSSPFKFIFTPPSSKRTPHLHPHSPHPSTSPSPLKYNLPIRFDDIYHSPLKTPSPSPSRSNNCSNNIKRTSSTKSKKYQTPSFSSPCEPANNFQNDDSPYKPLSSTSAPSTSQPKSSAISPSTYNKTPIPFSPFSPTTTNYIDDYDYYHNDYGYDYDYDKNYNNYNANNISVNINNNNTNNDTTNSNINDNNNKDEVNIDNDLVNIILKKTKSKTSKTKRSTNTTDSQTTTTTISTNQQHDNNIKIPEFKDIVCIVDNREIKSKTDREYIVNRLKNVHGIQAETSKLEVGDVVWMAIEKENSGNRWMLDFVIERKRVDDLSNSIIDGRYKEQKFRLLKCGCRNVYYLVEGQLTNTTATTSSSSGGGGGGGRYRPGYQNHKWGSVNYSLSPDKLTSAMVSTYINNDIMVIDTKDIDESISLMNNITLFLKERLIQKRPPSINNNNNDNSNKITIKEEIEILKQFIFKGDWYTRCDLEQFNKQSQKNKSLKLKELFALQLMQIIGCSGEKAYAITQQYPTPTHLLYAYRTVTANTTSTTTNDNNNKRKTTKKKQDGGVHDNYNSDDMITMKRENLLSDIRFGNQNKKIGKELSKRIYEYYQC